MFNKQKYIDTNGSSQKIVYYKSIDLYYDSSIRNIVKNVNLVNQRNAGNKARSR